MKDAEIEEPFRLLQREVVLAAEAVEALKRDQRAAIDTLRLDVAVLKHCLLQLHPDLVTHFETTIRPKARIDFSLSVLHMLWWALGVNHRPT